MTAEALKKKIKKKFGKYSNFTTIAGINRYEFQRDFLQANRVEKKDLKRIEALCDKLNPEDDPRVIPAALVDRLRAQIIDSYGSVSRFSEETKFSEQTVRQVLNGIRKQKTELVVKIFAHFYIPI